MGRYTVINATSEVGLVPPKPPPSSQFAHPVRFLPPLPFPRCAVPVLVPRSLATMSTNTPIKFCTFTIPDGSVVEYSKWLTQPMHSRSTHPAGAVVRTKKTKTTKDAKSASRRREQNVARTDDRRAIYARILQLQSGVASLAAKADRLRPFGKSKF
ncbi:hypothetical protein DICSQDRAFT_181614 [Dichomitus squalens LYAD-421 SS1]|uniref:Uncharacterized protein n=1 Tax=Dichomitus squalens (strain LYAD-421) TaxID=732165 RepID=R7SVF8_DICSQ|nr:uncharacterized protein DICSQDRAFT_181614 [Dichomitus squalens LYAD-421 SS1]EJF60056.1 hypothetical protein DICSQDRAFT_181614 [Dichomitus squalens LYAD-421 SS1]